MDWIVVTAPIAGLVGVLIGAGISSWTQRSTHRERLAAERHLTDRRIEADTALAERKFALDVEFGARKRRIELAEPALSDFYRARDVLTWARFPGSFGNEGATRIRGEDETEDQARNLNNLYVPVERLNRESELFSRLMASRYRFAANFGEEAAAPFAELHRIRNEIVSAAQHLMAERRDQERAAMHNTWEAVIGWGLTEEDPILPRIDAAVAAMEAVCRPILGQDAPPPAA